MMAEGGTEFMQMARRCFDDQQFTITSCLNFHEVYPFVVSGGMGWRHSAISSVWDPADPGRMAQWAQNGQAITALIKTDTVWQIFLSEGTGITRQGIKAVEGWPGLKDHIVRVWENDLVVTDIVRHEDTYVVVASGGLGWEQDWYLDPGHPQDMLLQAAADDGMVVSEVVEVEGQYLWITSANTGFSINYVETEPTVEFFQMIMAELEKPTGFNGYQLSLIREMQGRVCLVFSR
jgi:hypothetical protein